MYTRVTEDLQAQCLSVTACHGGFAAAQSACPSWGWYSSIAHSLSAALTGCLQGLLRSLMNLGRKNNELSLLQDQIWQTYLSQEKAQTPRARHILSSRTYVSSNVCKGSISKVTKRKESVWILLLMELHLAFLITAWTYWYMHNDRTTQTGKKTMASMQSTCMHANDIYVPSFVFTFVLLWKLHYRIQFINQAGLR